MPGMAVSPQPTCLASPSADEIGQYPCGALKINRAGFRDIPLDMTNPGAPGPAARRSLVDAERSAAFLDAVVLAFRADRAASTA